jgi:hypothetical protein
MILMSLRTWPARGRQSSPRDIWLASTIPVLIIAGAAGYHYAMQGDRLSALFIYTLSLFVSVLVHSKAHRMSRHDAVSHVASAADELFDASAPTTIAESIGAPERIHRTVRCSHASDGEQPFLVQTALDFDGIEAMRALELITGSWLVCEASQRAADLIRQACIDHLAGNDAELARIKRWLDITESLRSAECRALSKAEARRSYVAAHCGVSKEQVRQIDQGRYQPLNKVLQELDPNAVASQIYP